MDELAPRSVWSGLDLPLLFGRATLSAGPDATIHAIAPFRNQASAVGDALGAALPAPGRSVHLPDGGVLMWAGLDLWLLVGHPAPVLGGAAVTDQSDGWMHLVLTGEDAGACLARLVPLDLAPEAFPPDSVSRTQLGHIMCLIVARETGYDLLAQRSYARTVVHEIETTMRSISARRLIR